MIDVDALLAAVPYRPEWQPKAGKAKHAAAAGPGTHSAAADAMAKALPPSISGHGGDEALLKAATELSTVLGEDAGAIASALAVFNGRCIPPWPESKLKREAERAAARQANPESRFARRRAAKAAEAAPEMPPDQPLILVARRDANHVLLWSGEDRGHQPVARGNLLLRMKELGLECETTKNSELVDRQGRTFNQSVYDFAAPVSKYDAENDRVVVGYPQANKHEGECDDAVDQWLRALAGDDYDRITDWIASCAQAHIDKLAAMLVLIGEADTGKTLFATACAGLWGESAAPKAKLLVDRFNGDLIRCPILLDDEAELLGSKEWSAKGFREVMQSRERSIERKGQERFQLRGGIRIVVTCNGLGDLHFTDMSGPAVVQAVSDRLCLVDASTRADECRETLAQLKSADRYDVDLDRIVRHFAWIAECNTLADQRFIGGRKGPQGSVLAGHVDTHAEFFEPLRDWLDGDANANAARGWQAFGGRLCVDPQMLAGADDWKARQVRDALAPFKLEGIRPRVEGKRPRLVVIGHQLLADAMKLDATKLVERLAASADGPG